MISNICDATDFDGLGWEIEKRFISRTVLEIRV